MRLGRWAGAILLLLASCAALSAAETAWRPSPGRTQVPIWPGRAPDLQPVGGPETTTSLADKLVAGEPVTWVENVSRPTMTVYPPRGANTGVAVIVFPGGGYYGLAIDLEGTEICDWLTSKGITGVLLKYRVPDSGPHGLIEPKAPTALEDAQRAVGLVRFHATKWRIDPNRIGVIGFSAGGHLVAAVSTHFDKRLYPTVDEADKESCRPEFAIAAYPGHLWKGGDTLELNPNIHVTSSTPPTFLLQAENDPVDNVNHSLAYYIALKNAKVPVEMHLYAQGGHGFALRPTGFAISGWPQLVERWLGTIGMMPR